MTVTEPRYDYVAQVFASPDKVDELVKSTLRSEWDMVTKPVPGAPSKYHSCARQTSATSAFLKHFPMYLEWDIIPDSGITQVGMLFRMPRRFYALACAIILSFFAFLTCAGLYIMERDSVQTPAWTWISSAWWLCYVMLIVLLLRYVGHFWLRYEIAADRLIGNVAVHLDSPYKSVKPPLACSRPLVSRKALRQWSPFCILVIAVLIQVTYLTAKQSPRETLGWTVFSSRGFLIICAIVVAILTALVIALTALSGSFPARLMLPFSTNAIVASGLFLLILVTPLVQEVFIQAGLLRLGYGHSLAHLEGPRIIHLTCENTQPPLKPGEARRLATCIVSNMIALPILCSFMGLTVILLGTYHTFLPNILGIHSEHQASVVNAYKSRHQSTLMEGSAKVATTLIVWLLFVGLVVVLWSGVLLNVSVACAVVDPDLLCLYSSDGATLVAGAQALMRVLLDEARAGNAGAILGLADTSPDHVATILGKIAVVPTLFPFIAFVGLHAYYWIRRWSRPSLVPLKGEFPTKVEDIAKQSGVAKIHCMFDEAYGGVSPYAEVSGLIPRKKIVFGPATMHFLRENPKYVEVIIAHEIGHLKKNHCRHMRWLGIISRLGLVGTGFLGITLDSVVMEDEADDTARRYLEAKNLPGDILREAAQMMEVWASAIDSQRYRSPSVAAFASDESRCSKKPRHKKSVFDTVQDHFRAAFHFYFELELYHYVHRDARMRRKLLRDKK